MEENALDVLRILEDNGHEAYIVGGYVRDKILGIKSNDIDICTSATPKEIMALFENRTTNYKYGSVGIIYKNMVFDVTTYRKDIKYEDNRRPVKVRYIKNIKTDLLRRDFTVNTLCMDKNGNILDYLGVMGDIENKVIRTVGNPRYKLKEDALRILRAVRFATLLGFCIDKDTECYIRKYANLLMNLSYTRKRQELDKIFMSKNKKMGVKLILELGLDRYLDIKNLGDIVLCNDILGIWAQLDVLDIYPFTKVEKRQIEKIRELLSLDIYDKYNIYRYGLYKSCVVYQIRNGDTAVLNKIFSELPIKSRDDVNIKSVDVARVLGREPGSYLSEVMVDIEKRIVYGDVLNVRECLVKYLEDNYVNGSVNSSENVIKFNQI